jgi:NIMA (never in mitosis gene a)-related kinase
MLFFSSFSNAASVFLDDNHTVKLGDFGLSKALAQASFANTYVGVSN